MAASTLYPIRVMVFFLFVHRRMVGGTSGCRRRGARYGGTARLRS